jgi:hypothetical protein
VAPDGSFAAIFGATVVRLDVGSGPGFAAERQVVIPTLLEHKGWDPSLRRGREMAHHLRSAGFTILIYSALSVGHQPIAEERPRPDLGARLEVAPEPPFGETHRIRITVVNRGGGPFWVNSRLAWVTNGPRDQSARGELRIVVTDPGGRILPFDCKPQIVAGVSLSSYVLLHPGRFVGSIQDVTFCLSFLGPGPFKIVVHYRDTNVPRGLEKIWPQFVPSFPRLDAELVSDPVTVSPPG